MNTYDDIVRPEVESGKHDRELGEMVRACENANVTASEIKDRLCHVLLRNMAQESNADGIIETVQVVVFMGAMIVISVVFLITP